MKAMGEIFKKITVTAALASFVLIGAFSLPHFSMNMAMAEDGTMAMENCYMPGMAAICKMNAAEHIATWQKLFTVTVQQFSAELVMLMLALSLVVSRLILQILAPPHRHARPKDRYRYRDHIVDPIQYALSRGIIHPKVY